MVHNFGMDALRLQHQDENQIVLSGIRNHVISKPNAGVLSCDLSEEDLQWFGEPLSVMGPSFQEQRQLAPAIDVSTEQIGGQLPSQQLEMVNRAQDVRVEIPPTPAPRIDQQGRQAVFLYSYGMEHLLFWLSCFVFTCLFDLVCFPYFFPVPFLTCTKNWAP